MIVSLLVVLVLLCVVSNSFHVHSINKNSILQSNHLNSQNSCGRFDYSSYIHDKSTSLPMATTEAEIPLTPFERFSRAASFYRAAIPVFASYKGLDLSLKLQKQFLNKNISKEEEEKLFEQLHDWGSSLIYEKIKELKGFYVKTGQIISTRVDIFPIQYTSKLSVTLDSLEVVPAQEIKDIIQREILNGADLSELFLEFDDVPLGSASIAQVHKAKLLDGRTVAIKVQRPNVESKLLGDIKNLINFARIIRDSLPLDYYKIFKEIEKTLIYELDFLYEAQATIKVAAAIAHDVRNKPRKPPLTVPLPIPGLVSKRVMVLEFVDGIALSKLANEMKKKGIEAGSPESIIFGKKLLNALTDAYSSMIFGSGIIHGDPHPGNIFVMEDGEIALLDCGQVKQISTEQRVGLANLIMMVNEWETLNNAILKASECESLAKDINNTIAQKSHSDKYKKKLETISNLSAAEIEEMKNKLSKLTGRLAKRVKEFGVDFKEGAGDECAAAVAIVLFGNSKTKLPGGYAGEELSPNSPINQVTEFPSEFVLLGRASVMIKGIANRLGIPWSLSDRWGAVARDALLATEAKEILPIWSVARPAVSSTARASGGVHNYRKVSGNERIRFKEVVEGFFSWCSMAKQYIAKKSVRLAKKYLPEKIFKALLSFWVKYGDKLFKPKALM